jgi:hypothetical protein
MTAEVTGKFPTRHLFRIEIKADGKISVCPIRGNQLFQTPLKTLAGRTVLASRMC